MDVWQSILSIPSSIQALLDKRSSQECTTENRTREISVIGRIKRVSEDPTVVTWYRASLCKRLLWPTSWCLPAWFWFSCSLLVDAIAGDYWTSFEYFFTFFSFQWAPITSLCFAANKGNGGLLYRGMTPRFEPVMTRVNF